jgi:hypothetical protein
MTAIGVSPIQAVPNMVPDYEIRLLLNPTAVLNPGHKLTHTVLSTFEIPPTVTKLNVQFLDKSSKELYAADWSARMRKIENEDNDGFNAGNTKYEAQVDWGYQKQTLSISRKKTIADTRNSGMDLPGTTDSRKMLIDEAPDKFDNWTSNKWGTSTLAVSRIFGPVLARRSIGSWNGMPLFLEIWPLLNIVGTGIEYIIEASFKTESRKAASLKQSKLAAFLQRKGWFLAQDLLKTQLIMERY